MVSVRGLRLEAWRERARESFWVVPLLGVMLAVVVGGTLPRLELRLESMQMFWLFDGGPDAARSVLSSIAGSMITVTSLTFSLTVVTLQLASSQFSPRLLRSFLRDLRNQSVLALLLATFTFSLLVMLTVRTQDERGPAFVPPLSVTLAVVMVIASVVALVWFIGHIVTVVRVGHIMSDVTKESVELLEHEADGLDSPLHWMSAARRRWSTGASPWQRFRADHRRRRDRAVGQQERRIWSMYAFPRARGSSAARRGHLSKARTRTD